MLAGISVECVQVAALGPIDTGRATGRSSIANNADSSLLQWGSEMSGASVLRTPPRGRRSV
jgi:hypothetical protein